MTSPALSRITALAYCYRNADQLAMEGAAANLDNNCPAFWHTSTSTGGVSGLMSYLNDTQDVLRACEAYEAAFRRPCPYRTEAMLDLILPLNPAAVHSLANAYEAVKSWRSARELFARMDKADDRAFDAALSLRAAGNLNVLFDLDPARIDATLSDLSRPVVERSAAA